MSSNTDVSKVLPILSIVAVPLSVVIFVVIYIINSVSLGFGNVNVLSVFTDTMVIVGIISLASLCVALLLSVVQKVIFLNDNINKDQKNKYK